MNNQRAPLIAIGQLYLNEYLNEYIVVTKNHRRQVSYAGHGITGLSDDETFLDRFKPVDPADVEDQDLEVLSSLVPGSKLSVGFIRED